MKYDVNTTKIRIGIGIGNLVPMERLELSRYYYRGILNPLRLPFRHIGSPCGLPASPNAAEMRRQSDFDAFFEPKAVWSKMYRNPANFQFQNRAQTNAVAVRWCHV